MIGIVHADPFQVTTRDVPEGLNDVGELRVLILMGEMPVSFGGIPWGFTLNESSSFGERVKNVGKHRFKICLNIEAVGLAKIIGGDIIGYTPKCIIV